MKNCVLLCVCVIVVGCSKQENAGSGAAVSASILAQTEAAFSKHSEDSGFHSALKAYAAPEATKLVDQHFPIIGRDSLAAILDSQPDTGIVMTWKTRQADISASGDLGYTWGDWMFRKKYPQAGDTLFGNYFTVWKKQPDGSWKWVLDGGNTTPRP